MTLDDAIKHAENVANRCTTNVYCAEEHRQLAEWLKELKRYREIRAKIERLPEYETEIVHGLLDSTICKSEVLSIINEVTK